VLVDGAQEGVVHRDDDLAITGLALPGHLYASLDVHEGVGGVGGSLYEDHAQAALPVSLGEDPAQTVETLEGGEARRLDAELGQHLVEQVFGASVDGLGEDHQVTRRDEGEDRGGDGGHTALEHGGRVCPVPHRQTILQDLQPGIVQSGVDEARRLRGGLLPEAVSDLEEGLPRLGGLEDEGGRLEDRWLGGTFGPLGSVPEAHHQALGAHVVVADVLLLLLVPHEDRSCSRARGGDVTPAATAEATGADFVRDGGSA
jgi:hypothetical protein